MDNAQQPQGAQDSPAPKEAQADAKREPRRRSYVGVVSSAAGDKTIRVVMQHLMRHPRYGKYMRRQTKLAAHDEKNVAQKGDVVEIIACRRISKSKSFRLLRVIRRGTPEQAAAIDARASK
jgi:small subunit ribosomal protein S17